jgi:elongation factor Ts
MPEISADLIKELRAKTSAGVLDCKKALMESGGDLEKAVDILRKSGAAKADKKTGRITSEGRVAIKSEGDKAVILEVNCETDFVAKNQDFQNFVDGLAEHILKQNLSDLEGLLQSNFKGQKVQEILQGMVAKIGENISVRRFHLLKASGDEQIGSYIHLGNKIGVLVKVKGPKQHLDVVPRDIAMHVAASSPQYLAKENIPTEVVAREKEIYREQLKDSNKPPQVLEKILEGKLARFADDVCLMNQAFVKDPTGKQNITQYLKQVHPEIKVVEFVRYQVGEGLAKREGDFAAEVAKQLKQ